MERIRDAVEQANRERKKSQSSPASHAKSADVGGGEQAPSSPDSIIYTETRSVDVDLAVREKFRLAAAIPNHPLQDTYRMLRTSILQEMKAKGWVTMAVTSPSAGAGKSLTAINLAISIAKDMSYTATIVDADLRNPSISEYFGYEPEFGINDYLFNDVPLSKVFFHPKLDRLTVLPGREPIADSGEILTSPKFVSLVKELRARYPERIVILDMAPVLLVDDVMAMAPNIDCVLMVAESGVTTADDLQQALQLLKGVPVIGTVLNKVDKKIAATAAY
jgi:protein-tyrosine kinase